VRRDDAHVAQDFLDKAETKFQKAIESNPEICDAWTRLGIIYEKRAECLSEAENYRNLTYRAKSYYKIALEIKPDDYNALGNLARLFLDFADNASTATEKIEFFIQADIYLSRQEEIKPGAGAYDLACLSTRRGQLADARSWLEKAETHGKLPTAEHVKSDTDLDPLRDEQWFRDLVARHEAGEPE